MSSSNGIRGFLKLLVPQFPAGFPETANVPSCRTDMLVKRQISDTASTDIEFEVPHKRRRANSNGSSIMAEQSSSPSERPTFRSTQMLASKSPKPIVDIFDAIELVSQEMRKGMKRQVQAQDSNTEPLEGRSVNITVPVITEAGDSASAMPSFPFLALPFDIIATVVSFASNEDLISYSQTSHVLRLCSCRIYLHRLGIVKSGDRCVRVTLGREFPPVAVQIATSFLAQSLGSIYLICDFFTLRHFYWDICNFILSSNISCLQILYHPDEDLILWDSATALALGAVLGSIKTSLTSFSILHGFRATSQALAHNSTSLRRRRSMLRKMDRQIFPNSFMDGLRYLNIDSASFPTPALHDIYSTLFMGATLCSLNLTCDDFNTYQEFVQRTHFPNLQVLQVTVRSSFSICPNEQFLRRHPLLDVFWLLNSPKVGQTNELETIPITSRQELKLPDVRHVRIAANYSGWKIQDTSLLSLFEIQTMSPFMHPTSGSFCQTVRALCGVMVTSSHLPLQANFVLGISFPEHFGTHLQLSCTSAGFKCECGECATNESTIDNVESLKLVFGRLDDFFISFLLRWLNWFPNLKSLTLESTETKTPVTAVSLDGFRISCLNLKSVQHSNFGCDPSHWIFGGCNRGSQRVWKQIGVI
ncbi:hypothetical protein GALMADRAFT_216162 [Galerina marginata CBS 339.88]|uniref:F-box domain-containing protein n=1 Tax=Galerina marginata (strain CBS 339.88) TaxID=685588 RepID=A0A067SA40_GALM3|nr:hypothetical protein GALMADRAFT_216162 [Galerina marginata CBS 339.88]